MINHIGFTGTRNQPKPQQVEALDNVFTLFIKTNQADHDLVLHHGDCIGADTIAHRIATRLDFYTDIHPPTNPSKRSMLQSSSQDRLPQTYLRRNQEIVDTTSILVAVPHDYEEIARSGTWATIRYARKKNKPIVIIWPDGTITTESWGV